MHSQYGPLLPVDEQLCWVLQLQILRTIPLLHVRGVSIRSIHFCHTFLLRSPTRKVRHFLHLLLEENMQGRFKSASPTYVIYQSASLQINFFFSFILLKWPIPSRECRRHLRLVFSTSDAPFSGVLRWFVAVMAHIPLHDKPSELTMDYACFLYCIS